MKRSIKVMLLVLAVAVVGGILLSGCGSSSSSSSPVVSGTTTTTYSGTLYMASGADTLGPGGHIGVFSVTIDPSNTTNPIQVDANSVNKIQLFGTPGTMTAPMIHDVRFGVNSDGTTNYNKIYYSGMMSVGTATTVVPIGYVDVTNYPITTTHNSTIDFDNTATGPFTNGMDTIAYALSQIAPNEFGTGTRIDYCASGMNANYYFPMSMSFPAYIDAIPVANLDGRHLVKGTDFQRTYIGQIDDAMNLSLWTGVTTTITTQDGTVLPLNALGVPPLAFIHGASSPDGTKIYMSTNQMAGLTEANNTAGNLRAYMINASKLVSGGVTTNDVLAKNISIAVASSNSTTLGDLEGTIAYRASFTPNGQYILQSGSDRLIILKASDLTEYVDSSGTGAAPSGASAAKTTAIASGLGAGTFGGIEVHDVIATPDSRYAILSLRYYTDALHASGGIKNSGVQLYDIANKTFIGKVATTCGLCHASSPAADGNSRDTCGLISHLTVTTH